MEFDKFCALVLEQTIPRVLYHATSEQYVNSIAKNGLMRNAKNKMFDCSDENFIYLATNAQHARAIVESSGRFDFRGNVNVISIDATKLNPKLISRDEDPWLEAAGVVAYKYAGPIPASLILDYGD